MLDKTASWAEQSDVIPMFPTLVWKIELKPELRERIDARALQLIARLRKGAPPLTAGRGWQSVQDLHTHEELEELVSCVNRAAAGIIRFLRIGEQALEITACWATILAPGGEHRAHCHPNNYLSGVYYLRTRSGADTINFHDPRSQTEIIRPPVSELTGENTDQVVVQVRAGTLLLFPSFLRHSVAGNSSAAERMSISFNIMFSAFTERLTRPLWSPDT
jgi:uncharacterized protein (TIGR02466 family)